jgi:hypothetical protein
MAAELQRLSALPLISLAAEIMARGFGPGGPGAAGRPGSLEVPLSSAAPVNPKAIAARFVPGYESRAISPESRWQLRFLMREGLQVLEHAGLVLLIWDPHEHYMATRLGRATLERGAVEYHLSGVTQPFKQLRES